MLETSLHSIKMEPVYNPHRVDVAVDDVAAPTHPAAGCSPTGFQFVNLDVKLHSATTQAILTILYWSDLAQKFVLASPSQAWTLTASASLSFEPRGRTFWVQVTGLLGATKLANVNAAGYKRESE